MTYGSLILLVFGLAVVAVLGIGPLGMYAFLRNRVPGRPLRRVVRNPRLWGLGLLLQVASLLTYSWAVLALGLLCTVCGHALRPAGRNRGRGPLSRSSRSAPRIGRLSALRRGRQ
ncbi:hypothetical protein ACFY1P_32290 [Streptomyces sp. NPDC001407]|uniref:hypothetical protein n=1 Tax=unclassified Streptomyces TaxID=2593676 RepID=UPI0033EDD7E2